MFESNFGTVNVWLIIGLVLAIFYLVWQVNSLYKALQSVIYLNNYSMTALDEMLQQRDAEVDQKISTLEEQVQYLGKKYGGIPDEKEEDSEVS